jgi:Mce-associated membrane protein
MNKDLPRRPASSRNPTSRPRKVAGRGSSAPAPTPEADAPNEPVEPVEPVSLAKPPARDSGRTEMAAPPGDGLETTDTQPGSLFASRRTTSVLMAVGVVLALVAAGLGIWLWQHDEDPVTTARDPDSNAIVVPEGRPVLLTSDEAEHAVAAAAEAASTIVATSYKDYDAQVDEAAGLMTDEFAEEYRQTAADVKQKILDTKTEVQVRIVAQGVVRANTSEVQALLFLNQYSSKDGGETTYTPYRALVTVVHTDTGWLVSGLDTQ